jgi:hypothetical protein
MAGIFGAGELPKGIEQVSHRSAPHRTIERG